MATVLNPYLGFTNNCRDAMAFYQSVLGGDLEVLTFAEGGMGSDSEKADLVMHSSLTTPAGFTLMASDDSQEPATGDALSISLSGDEPDALRTYWQKLSDGAEIIVPLEKAPWGDYFGMLRDRFGIRWLVNFAE